MGNKQSSQINQKQPQITPVRTVKYYESKIIRNRQNLIKQGISENKKPIKQNFQNNFKQSIQLNQNRNLIQNLSIWPFCTYCRITSLFKNGNIQFKKNGTGSLISKNLVLTCSNIVFDNTHNIEAKRVQIQFFENINKQPKKYKTVKIMYHQFYKQPEIFEHQNYNLAVLQLQAEDISDIYGFMGISSDSKDYNKKALVYGFNSDQQNLKFDGKEVNYKIKKNKIMLQNQIQIYDSQQGSPIVILLQQQYKIIGILQQKQSKRGLLFNDLSVKNINNWTSQIKYRLDLNHQNIDAKQMQNLILVDNRNISDLNLQGNNLDQTAMKYFAQSNKFSNLNTLNLGDNHIGIGGLKYLVLGSFPQLIYLYLFNNQLGNQGIKILSQAKFNKLTTLHLGSNQLDNDSLKYFNYTRWPNILVLNLVYNNFNPNVKSQFKIIYPKAKLYI